MKSYSKSFSDRYSHSRELQLLDLLSQRTEGVPKLLGSDSSHLTIEMSYVGKSLDRHLPPFDQNELTAYELVKVSADAIGHLIELESFGVWHLDFNPRNIMVDRELDGRLQVKLIDFSVCIARDFKLKKPLWVRPSRRHHIRFSEAVISDWQGFFSANHVEPPSDYYAPFDIDIESYQCYWHDDLAIDRLMERTVITAHQASTFLELVADNLENNRPLQARVRDLSKPLFSLHNDEEARCALNITLKELRAILNLDDVGVKFRADPEKTPVPHHRPLLTRISRTSTSEIQPTGEDRTIRANDTNYIEGISVASSRVNFLSVVLMTSLLSLGGWLLDYVYSKHQVLITETGFVVLGAAFIATIIIFIVLALTKATVFLKVLSLILSSTGFMFSIQIFLHNAALLEMAALSALVFLGVLIVGFFPTKSNARTVK